MKNYKVKELLNKYGKYNINVFIESETKNFDIIFKKSIVPHLLGLQYMNQDISSERAWMLINNVINNNLSDEDILERVNKYHGEKQRENVNNRINTLEYFLDNLEKSIVVEKTLKTNMQINYLLIQDENTKEIKHLGICSTDNGALLVSYEDLTKQDKDFFRTYFVENNKDYYNNTKIFEKIKSIQVYNEESNEYLPFSFDEEKNKYLIDNWEKNKDGFDYIKTIKNYYLDKENLCKIEKQKNIDDDLER